MLTHNRISKTGPGGANRAMSEIPKNDPTDADRAITEVPTYEPTNAERAAPNRQAQRQKEQPPAPRFNMVADYRRFGIEQNHPDKIVTHLLLKDALGTADDGFCEGLLGQLCELSNIEGKGNQLREVIDVLRSREVSWAQIGAALGISRQSAWERFS
jgi:hypothetical protein